ncbi:MAG TPA: hypothetical protein VG267_11325 [Terracidiphilus sp.]|jgi:hypothetical protein|nr:hypothetical protein [Terracidiphilus sp.]
MAAAKPGGGRRISAPILSIYGFTADHTAATELIVTTGISNLIQTHRISCVSFSGVFSPWMFRDDCLPTNADEFGWEWIVAYTEAALSNCAPRSIQHRRIQGRHLYPEAHRASLI